jgi:hypothetical protein
MTSDEQKRKERAAALRKRVNELIKSADEEAGTDKAASNADRKESPRQFVERRMREINKEKAK